MLTKLLASFAVGLVLAAILFIPLTIWQYRRYGRFAPGRMLWIVAGCVYAAGVVAFTIFPLPTFSPEFCAKQHVGPIFDLLRVPREFLEVVQAKGFVAALGDWVVWETICNFALFVPFGILARRLLEWRPAVVIGAAFTVSLAIELTQLTGNWGLAPCAYRIAEVTDLVTNTLGAAIGVAVAAALPALLTSTTQLQAERERPRPVTRTRRVHGMLIDIAALVAAATLAAVQVLAVGLALTGVRRVAEPTLSEAAASGLISAMVIAAVIAVGLVLLLPACFGRGASLGQRAVHLAPEARPGLRWRMLVRAFAVQGAFFVLPALGALGVMLSILLLGAALVAVLVTPRGLSYLVAGCRLVDARAETASRATATVEAAPFPVTQGSSSLH